MDLLIEIIKANPWWQLFWFLAMWVAFIWLLQKNDKQTVKIIILSSALWVIHFFLMWLYSTMIVSCIWIIRLFLSLKYKRNRKVFLAILSSLFIVWVMTFENKFSVLPIIWSCLTAYWYFFCEWVRLRLCIFISSTFRLTFNFNVWSIWWIINEIVSQVILVFVMYKLIRDDDSKVFEKIKLFFRKKPLDTDKFFPVFDYIETFKKWFINRLKLLNRKIKVFIIKLKSKIIFNFRFKKSKL